MSLFGPPTEEDDNKLFVTPPVSTNADEYGNIINSGIIPALSASREEISNLKAGLEIYQKDSKEHVLPRLRELESKITTFAGTLKPEDLEKLNHVEKLLIDIAEIRNHVENMERDIYSRTSKHYEDDIHWANTQTGGGGGGQATVRTRGQMILQEAKKTPTLQNNGRKTTSVLRWKK